MHGQWIISSRFDSRGQPGTGGAHTSVCSYVCACVCMHEMREREREIGKRASERYTRRVTSLSSSSSPLTSCLCSAFPPHCTLSRKSVAGETDGFIRLQRCSMQANFRQNNIQHVIFDLNCPLQQQSAVAHCPGYINDSAQKSHSNVIHFVN